VEGFCIKCVETLDSATREWLINKMDLCKIGCEDGRWMKLAECCVQLKAFILTVLKFQVN
jgi:hypothetical protein